MCDFRHLFQGHIFKWFHLWGPWANCDPFSSLASWDLEKENVFKCFDPLTKMATMPILGICVFGSYDYPGSSGECYRTIMVLLLTLVILNFYNGLIHLSIWIGLFIVEVLLKTIAWMLLIWYIGSFKRSLL